MKITFLGTGTSSGIPLLGCQCPVCCSNDLHDKRLRTSALLESEAGTRVLIDCGPDFRQQMLNHPVESIDAVLLTHLHYDHVGGLDDLRPFSIEKELPIYADRRTSLYIKERLPYCFQSHPKTFVPRFALHTVQAHKSFNINELEVTPIKVMHGKMPIHGFRIGKLAYLTDLKTLPESEFCILEGVDTLVVNALHRHKQHPTHQNFPEALEFAARVGAKRTYFIHLSHHAGFHAECNASLPKGIHLAYDGLVLDIDN